MAPMATTYVPKFLKRTASQAQFENPAPKKPTQEAQTDTTKSSPITQRLVQPPTKSLAGVWLPKLKWDQQRHLRRNGATLDERAVQSMLTRSIQLALMAVGFEAAEPEALDEFRAQAEEYMAHLLATVRRYMLGSRRIQALPQDFLQALHPNQLTLRALLPHLNPPVPHSQSQYKLASESTEDSEQQHVRLLASFQDETMEGKKREYIPRHFPNLPSTHTFKATPEFPEREYDPRRIRERATEEARLGEEALRRLVGAASDIPVVERSQEKRKKSAREQRDDMWRKTMADIENSNPETSTLAIRAGTSGLGTQGSKDALKWNGHLGSVVNAEKRYWRTPKRS